MRASSLDAGLRARAGGSSLVRFTCPIALEADTAPGEQPAAAVRAAACGATGVRAAAPALAAGCGGASAGERCAWEKPSRSADRVRQRSVDARRTARCHGSWPRRARQSSKPRGSWIGVWKFAAARAAKFQTSRRAKREYGTLPRQRSRVRTHAHARAALASLLAPPAALDIPPPPIIDSYPVGVSRPPPRDRVSRPALRVREGDDEREGVAGRALRTGRDRVGELVLLHGAAARAGRSEAGRGA